VKRVVAVVGSVALATVVLSLSALVQLSSAAPMAQSGVVASVYDGDTLTLRSGQRVRLLQIDTPELGSGECYSRAARTALLSLMPIGSRVTLESDARLDRVDRYGRLLRYVHRGSLNVNLQLVKRGAAAPYFYRGDRGKYASRLIAEAQRAKGSNRGLWNACPSTRLDPYRAVDTGRSGPAGATPPPTGTTPPPNGTPPPTGTSPPPTGTTPPPTGNCDPNYSGCVPKVAYDLDCADIRALGIAPVRVIGTDVHRLDGDGDGWGCE
jgi:endonuclease YncB( thermonuclease family)